MLIYGTNKSSSISAHKIMLVFRIFATRHLPRVAKLARNILSLFSQRNFAYIFMFLFAKEMHKSISSFSKSFFDVFSLHHRIAVSTKY